MRRAVFLDRDGVINRTVVRGGRPYPPSSCEEVEILPGVTEAIADLKAAGFLVVVVTNQPDVATGRQRREIVDAIHARIKQTVPIDDLKVCFHSDEEQCSCRKPRPGMLFEAARQWDVDLTRSFMIGDRWRDIEAGNAAGCRTILVGDRYEERPADGCWAAVPSLLEASALILAETQEGQPGTESAGAVLEILEINDDNGTRSASEDLRGRRGLAGHR